MDRKLTPLQIETLALAHDGKVLEHRYGYGAWRIRGANPSTVGKLRSWGFLTRVSIGPDDFRFDVTDDGHAAIARGAV